MGKIVHWATITDGRFIDAERLPTSVAASGYQGPLKKTRIASYFGNQWAAEREGESLVIYHLGSGVGLPVDLVGGSAGDASPRVDAKRMQQISEAWRARNAPVKRVRATGR